MTQTNIPEVSGVPDNLALFRKVLLRFFHQTFPLTTKTWEGGTKRNPNDHLSIRHIAPCPLRILLLVKMVNYSYQRISTPFMFWSFARGAWCIQEATPLADSWVEVLSCPGGNASFLREEYPEWQGWEPHICRVSYLDWWQVGLILLLQFGFWFTHSIY